MFRQYYIEHLLLFLEKYPFFFLKVIYLLKVEITSFLNKKVINRANEGITKHSGSPGFDLLDQFFQIKFTMNYNP